MQKCAHMWMFSCVHVPVGGSQGSCGQDLASQKTVIETCVHCFSVSLFDSDTLSALYIVHPQQFLNFPRGCTRAKLQHLQSGNSNTHARKHGAFISASLATVPLCLAGKQDCVELSLQTAQRPLIKFSTYSLRCLALPTFAQVISNFIFSVPPAKSGLIVAYFVFL